MTIEARITSIEENPLHGADIDGDHWWACERPEARHQDWVTHYDLRCKPCAIAQVAAIEGGHFTGELSILDVGGSVIQYISTREWLELARPLIRETHGF